MRPNPNNYVHLGLKTIFLYQKHLRTLENKYFNSKNQAQKFFLMLKKIFSANFFHPKFYFWFLCLSMSKFANFFWAAIGAEVIDNIKKYCRKWNKQHQIDLNPAGQGKKRLWNFDLPYPGPYPGISGSRVAV